MLTAKFLLNYVFTRQWIYNGNSKNFARLKKREIGEKKEKLVLGAFPRLQPTRDILRSRRDILTRKVTRTLTTFRFLHAVPIFE